jgi:signal transduction histidine kinase
MLNRLRWQLTLLYLLVAAGLVVLIGGGSYALVLNYFHNSTDLALAYKMAGLFETYNIPLPPELAQAQNNWNVNNLNLDISRFLSNSPHSVANLPPTAYPTPTQSQVSSTSYGEKEDGESPENGESEGRLNASTAVATPTSSKPHESETSHSEDPYDARLAPIFVLPLNDAGQLISNPNPAPVPVTLNQAAWEAALKNGSDWRTIRLDNGTHVRLLTYRTNSYLGAGGSSAGSQATPAVLQIGRLLSDQDRVSSQLFSGLAILGGLSVLLLGAGSWWLSGRTMGPAQRAWDQQQQFVSNASHELRTPLTLLRATAEYGLRQSHTRSKSDVLKDVLDETDYMSKLVDDLLLLSRLDAQRLKLARDLIPLPELLGEVSRQMEKLALDQGVQIELGDVRGAVWGDPTRLRQVLLILLDNALRHTPAGGKIRLETGMRGRLRQIAVSDNGEGIPTQHLAHIFERFYQVDPGSNENRSSGLGLSIAKGLVEAQAGIIRVESQPGEGTRFSIALPGN